MTFRMNQASETLYWINRARKRIGSIWKMRDGSEKWKARAEGFEVEATTADQAFSKVVGAINRYELTGKRDATIAEAEAVIDKRNAETERKVEAHNRDLANLFPGDSQHALVLRALFRRRSKGRRITLG